MAIICICKNFNDVRLRKHLSERTDMPAEIKDPEDPYINVVFTGVSGCEEFECGKCPKKILVVVQEEIAKKASKPPPDSPAIRV
jgi:bacterioferritin-associated ferredoxin